MRRIFLIGKGITRQGRARVKEVCEYRVNAMGMDVKAGFIQILIPIGLWHVKERLEEEVRQIAGER